MRRIMVYDRFDKPLFELSENDVFALTRTERINGEHSLSITTTHVLGSGQRVLVQDDRGIWREYVVYGTDELHDSGQRPIGTYYATWSVQPDLMGTRVSRMPGTQTPVSAGVALSDALSGTARWGVGTVTNAAIGGASMYDTDGWSALSTLIDTWGGELSTTIEVGSFGVTARKVDLYTRQGSQTPKRRFDFGADLTSVRRKLADGPLYCRITPRGRGEETDTGGYGRKITIESVNDGKDYLENAQMVDIAKLPDGQGGWEYPTIEIENGDCETPAELLAWSQGVVDEYTLPRITYEVDVLQIAREGIDMQGVSLGDAVHVVDRKFGDGLRLSGRVTEHTVDELTGKTAKLVIGYLDDGLSGLFGSLESRIGSMTETVKAMNGGTLSTAEYLSRLLDRLNAEINADGGYTYITEGQGIRTYDKAVSDPLVGAEADKAVEIKGGSVRIANSRTAQGDWDWKTLIVSGHIATELVTAAQLTAGYIGSAASGNYWNLDTGEFRLSPNALIGADTFASIITSINDDIENLQSQVDGNITSWFYAVDPTLSNEPASTWTTTADKDAHLGDLYYNTTSGHAWRWVYEDGAYSWARIEDESVARALADAARAQDTADSKRRVFVTTPIPPYDVGDLWTQGTTGDILTCTTARASGSYSASDWSKSSKYTDDTAVGALNASLNQQEVFNRLTNNGASQGIYLSDGQLYINGTYINTGTLNADLLTTGRLIVRDSSNHVLFDANIGATPPSVAIAGFNVQNDSLYSGLSSIDGTSTGVYLGVDGFAMRNSSGNSTKMTPGGGIVSKSGNYSMSLSDGTLTATNISKNRGGYIDASAHVLPENASSYRYGVRMHGDEIVAIDAPMLAISKDGGSSWGTCVDAQRKLLALSSISMDGDNLLTLKGETDTEKVVNGLEVLNWSKGSPPIETSISCTGSYRLATKAYVDNAVPSLSEYATKDWVSQQLQSYATQSWVSSQGYLKAALRLSGDDLYITT